MYSKYHWPYSVSLFSLFSFFFFVRAFWHNCSFSWLYSRVRVLSLKRNMCSLNSRAIYILRLRPIRCLGKYIQYFLGVHILACNECSRKLLSETIWIWCENRAVNRDRSNIVALLCYYTLSIFRSPCLMRSLKHSSIHKNSTKIIDRRVCSMWLCPTPNFQFVRCLRSMYV